MVRSVEDLERLANTRRPPLTLKELMKISNDFRAHKDRKALDELLADMEKEFRGRGNLDIWPDNILTQIDDCFVKHFYVDKVPRDSLFYPSHPENITNFIRYCENVDAILKNDDSSPPYAREYFVYAMQWQKRGQRFPVPLGTRSVIEAVYNLTKKYRRGLTEVCNILCLPIPHKQCTDLCTHVRRV